jgi:putative addiction module killer protein
MVYTPAMFTLRRTPQFDAWFNALRDGSTQRRLLVRLRKATLGNLGDVKPVGGGVFEMREFFGPGWRMYYVQRGAVVIVMLGGGDKASQQRDIATAQALATTIED